MILQPRLEAILSHIEIALMLSIMKMNNSVNSDERKVLIIIVSNLASVRHNIRYHLMKETCDCVYSEELAKEIISDDLTTTNDDISSLMAK